MGRQGLDIDGRRVRVADPDAPMWPGSSLTRADVLLYYLDVARELLPCLSRHPSSVMVRRAEGLEGWCFQRGLLPGLPAWIPRCRGWDELRMSSVECALVEERAALAHLVGAACLSFHPWNARAEALDRPDRMVFNLDPTDIGFREVRHAALLVRDLLARYHIRSWVKTSGGAGLHVMVPLRPGHGFAEVRAAAALVARAARAREPKLFTVRGASGAAARAHPHRRGAQPRGGRAGQRLFREGRRPAGLHARRVARAGTSPSIPRTFP